MLIETQELRFYFLQKTKFYILFEKSIRLAAADLKK